MHVDYYNITISDFRGLPKLIITVFISNKSKAGTQQYSWNTAKVEVKHKWINQKPKIGQNKSVCMLLYGFPDNKSGSIDIALKFK
jgi:hypothetical protein